MKQTHNVLVLENGEPKKLFAYLNNDAAERQFLWLAQNAGMPNIEWSEVLDLGIYVSNSGVKVVLIHSENEI